MSTVPTKTWSWDNLVKSKHDYITSMQLYIIFMIKCLFIRIYLNDAICYAVIFKKTYKIFYCGIY
jgi:hypothetical protein